MGHSWDDLCSLSKSQTIKNEHTSSRIQNSNEDECYLNRLYSTIVNLGRHVKLSRVTNINELRIEIRNMIHSLNQEMEVFMIFKKNLEWKKSSRSLTS